MFYQNLKYQVFPVLFLLVSALLWCQSSFIEEEKILEEAGFLENAEVRMSMEDTIKAPFYSLLTKQKEIHQQILNPIAVEFELRKSAESFYLLFKNEQDYKYPVWGRGNYIIKRDLRSGDFEQIKIFLQNDENSFLRLFPLDKKRTVLDLVLYGVTLYEGIVIPVSLEDLSVSPFSRLMHLTRGTIRWDRLFTVREYPEWSVMASLVEDISSELDSLHEEDDAAQDRSGDFVQIEDGAPLDAPGGVNCSGFAKWVADGLILGESKGVPGSLIPINILKQPTESLSQREQNPWSTARDDRDPYFGLDWTRNLSTVLAGILRGDPGENALAHDVMDVPFYTYRENIGYPLENIKSVLYLLAVKDPGAFYMGSINSLFGEDPVLWQYHHIALFFPWFSEKGDFQLSVLETGVVSSPENLEARYPDSFVHLVRVDRAYKFKNPSDFAQVAGMQVE